MGLTLGVHALASASASTVTTGAITTQATGSGIELVVNFEAAVTFTSVTDSKGNTWTQIGSEITDSGTVVKMRRYRCNNAIGGSGHTFTLTCSGANVCGIAVVEELASVGAGVALDQEGVINDTASAYDSGSETTTIADEMLIGGFTCQGGGGTYTHTVGNSFTLIDEETNGTSFFPLATMYRIVTATGTYNTTTTVTTTPIAALCSLDTFREAAGGLVGTYQRSRPFPFKPGSPRQRGLR